jgi:proteasome lid subunit RPN8/RPN11
LERQHIVILREEALKVHPVEACALLFGRVDSNEAHVSKVAIAPNKLQSTVRFEINPETVFKELNEAEREELDFIGLFHSHPASIPPSLTDQKGMKLWGDAIWLILSSTKGNLGAYKLMNGEVIEIPIIVESENTCEKTLKQ